VVIGAGFVVLEALCLWMRELICNVRKRLLEVEVEADARYEAARLEEKGLAPLRDREMRLLA